jgi:hypothetical protein
MPKAFHKQRVTGQALPKALHKQRVAGQALPKALHKHRVAGQALRLIREKKLTQYAFPSLWLPILITTRILPNHSRDYRLTDQKDRLSQDMGYIIDIRVEFSLHSAKNDLKTSASGQ